MIWLLSNVWWLVPLAIGGLALFAFLSAGPGALAIYLKIPRWLRLTVGSLVILLTAYSFGYDSGLESCRSAQEAGDDKADAKASRVAKGAQAKAQEALEGIRKETKESTDEAEQIVAGLPATCPPLPERLRELGRDAVQGASREMLSAEGR